MKPRILTISSWRVDRRFTVRIEMLGSTLGGPCTRMAGGSDRFPSGPMTVGWSRLWMMMILLLTGLTATAQNTNNTPGRRDFPAFKIITERNIFDPTRSPGSARRPDAPKLSRVESFALVGTLSYEKGTFAFFDGSASEFRRALKLSDTIAGYKVTGISSHGVELEAEGKRIELAVGMQMKRQDEGEWQAAGLAESVVAPAPATVASGEKTEDTSGGEESDVVKKLMQKREQENK